jgi:hypothetical protein
VVGNELVWEKVAAFFASMAIVLEANDLSKVVFDFETRLQEDNLEVPRSPTLGVLKNNLNPPSSPK